MSEATIRYHYSRHHQTYANNLNKALVGYESLVGTQTIEELLMKFNTLPTAIQATVRNNGGGLANHTLFWSIMKPNGGGNPTGAIADAITKEFGNYDNFKADFSKAASGRFGSGWAWLIVTPEGKLQVTSTANQDSPLMDGNKPVLTIDVWEHAYYLDYQNARGTYIENFYKMINWDEVNRQYANAMK